MGTHQAVHAPVAGHTPQALERLVHQRRGQVHARRGVQTGRQAMVRGARQAHGREQARQPVAMALTHHTHGPRLLHVRQIARGSVF